ncbi:MAG: hypothetical protein JWO06_1186 [Bacteroidota bacterium]|nr:hypothetical protein [Bacteroidota bacterium]
MAEKTVKPRFKVGDKVKLQSGGELMTVANLRMEINIQTVEADLFYGYVFCNWFEGDKLRIERFHQDMLELVN